MPRTKQSDQRIDLPPDKKPVLGYILKGYPRISETFISNEILLLEQLGFTLHLFPMRLPRESFCHESVKKIKAKVDYLPTELLPEFHRLLPANIFLAVKKPARYKAALAFAHKGISPGTRLATQKHLMQAATMTNNHLLKGQVDHLHGHFAHSPTSVTLFASILAALPFSFTAHAKDIYTSQKEKLRRKIEKARFVVTCTRYNADYLKAFASDTGVPIHCIYHGIDLDLFRPGKKKRTRPPYHFLTVARITEKKGLPTVYRALAILKDKGIDFSHTLIGEGDDREKTEQLIAELGLKSRCQLLGTRTHDEVLSQFGKSDIFMLGCEIAQNGDRDGIPNVLVESLAMGVPAVATAVSAIPEVLVDKITGRTVAAKDPEGFAQAVLDLLLDSPGTKKMVAAGTKKVREDFDNKRMVRQLARLFTENVSTAERKESYGS